MCLVPLATFAQTQKFVAYEFAVKVNSEWSEWEDCSISIKIDFDNDIVIIYSKVIQRYKVVREVEPPYDSLGEQVAFSVIDQDGDIGILRIRKMYNGIRQLYIDFSNVSWVYNIE